MHDLKYSNIDILLIRKFVTQFEPYIYILFKITSHTMKYWKKLSIQERKEIIEKALADNVDFLNDNSLGYPASKLDNRVFYSDAPFLKDAPTLQTFVANPNHIGCHTYGTSEKAFKGTQEIERMVLKVLAVDVFNLKVDTKMSSYSYVHLTISCLRRMGFTVFIKGQYLSVSKQQRFDGEYFQIEPDWTSFYYWLSIAHLAKEVDLFFPGLRLENMSRERTKLYDVGNKAMFFEEINGGIHITKKEKGFIEIVSDLNYTQFPDSAMTFAMLIPAVGKKHANLRGLDSLKYKECDREEALKNHLSKIGVQLTTDEEFWRLDATEYNLRPETYFETYDDHRMAMCVAPLALLQPIIMEDSEVVKKSYPHFWEDLKRVGFVLEEVTDMLDASKNSNVSSYPI